MYTFGVYTANKTYILLFLKYFKESETVMIAVWRSLLGAVGSLDESFDAL